MPTGLESFIGINMSARRPISLFGVARRSVRPPPLRSVVPAPPIARIAVESAVLLGAFVALTAFISRAVINRMKHVTPKASTDTSVDNFDRGRFAFESFQLTSI